MLLLLWFQYSFAMVLQSCGSLPRPCVISISAGSGRTGSQPHAGSAPTGYPFVSSAIEFQILAQTLTGKSRTLDVQAEDTIDQVKQEFLHESDLPPHIYGLVFAGKRLEDDRTIAYYNIAKQGTLFPVGRLLGGGEFMTGLWRPPKYLYVWSGRKTTNKKTVSLF